MWTKLIATTDIIVGEMVGISVDKLNLLIVKLDDRFIVYEDKCAHLGVPLSFGTLQKGVITCCAHHWQYDARTGKGINPLATQLRIYPHCIRDNALWADVDPAQ